MKSYAHKLANRIYPGLVFGITIGLTIGYTLANGYGHGIDWRDFRLWTLGLPHKQGVWNPHWTKLLLSPIAWLPPSFGHLFINIVTVTPILLVQRYNILPFFSKYVHSELWYGNLDGFVIVGIITSRLQNPYLVGAGLFLISIKPQFFPIALYYIYQSKDIRLIIVPLTGFILSLVYLGNWIPDWLALMPPTPKTEVNISLYPWSLPIWFLLPLAKDKERFVIAATALTMPYFNALSLIVLFAFVWPTWIILTFIVGSWMEVNTLVAIVALIYSLLRVGPKSILPLTLPKSD